MRGSGTGGVIPLLDQQPRLLALSALALHAHQRPVALEFFTMQRKLELAGFQPLYRIAQRHPDATVPDDDRTGSILSGRNGALKIGVRERVVFNLDGHAFDRRIQAGAFGHCPAFQRACQFQPKVVVQMAGVMLLDYKTQCFGTPATLHRLRRQSEVAFAFIGKQRVCDGHGTGAGQRLSGCTAPLHGAFGSGFGHSSGFCSRFGRAWLVAGTGPAQAALQQLGQVNNLCAALPGLGLLGL